MKKYQINKKYLLAVAAGLLTTAAVTATVLSTTKPNNTKSLVKKEVKHSDKASNSNRAAMHHCPFSF